MTNRFTFSEGMYYFLRGLALGFLIVAGFLGVVSEPGIRETSLRLLGYSLACGVLSIAYGVGLKK